jgi:hypothetical protein
MLESLSQRAASVAEMAGRASFHRNKIAKYLPRHGYTLVQDIESFSGGRVRMSTGTLFGALRRLLEDGWIERFELEVTSRRICTRAYKFLLLLYPRGHRDQFADEMPSVF